MLKKIDVNEFDTTLFELDLESHLQYGIIIELFCEKLIINEFRDLGQVPFRPIIEWKCIKNQLFYICYFTKILLTPNIC